VVPRSWKVIQHVREKVSCRDCEAIAQAPAPFHVIPRGWAGPSLLAMILAEKFGAHQPLNRQAERYAREGVDLSLSTLADQVGACALVLRPIFERIEAHVLAAERLRQRVSVDNASGLQGCGDVSLHPGRRSPLHLPQQLPVPRYPLALEISPVALELRNLVRVEPDPAAMPRSGPLEIPIGLAFVPLQAL
jgi:hypothetical protein